MGENILYTSEDSGHSPLTDATHYAWIPPCFFGESEAVEAIDKSPELPLLPLLKNSQRSGHFQNHEYLNNKINIHISDIKTLDIFSYILINRPSIFERKYKG